MGNRLASIIFAILIISSNLYSEIPKGPKLADKNKSHNNAKTVREDPYSDPRVQDAMKLVESCEKNKNEDCDKLAKFYKKDNGNKEQKELYKQCEKGEKKACQRLAVLQVGGEAANLTPEETDKLFEEACKMSPFVCEMYQKQATSPIKSK